MSGHRQHPHQEEVCNVDRYVGLSLGGGKSDRTSLTVIDYYRKQEKAFVIDVYDAIGPHDGFSADDVLLEIIQEFGSQTKVIATDAPLTLPPCLNGCLKSCEGAMKCERPAVRWMRNQYRRAKSGNKKLKCFTPYSQRPVDLFFRYKHLDQEIFQDETMGANLAPRAARMQYLKNRMGAHAKLIEVWPKLTLSYLQKPLHLTRQNVTAYRQLDEGVNIRESILETLIEHSSLFVYDRDAKKFVTNIAAFDSFICAWVAMLYDLDRCVDFKKDLPFDTGWVQIPEL